MKSRAAVLLSAPAQWEIVEVDVDEPKDHEVLVRFAATGLCHSDDHRAKGDHPGEVFPFCGGHEGAGVIEQVGPGVTGLAVGDHIVTSFIPGCGRCKWCASARQNLCDNGAQMSKGAQLDGAYRMHLNGEDVGQSCTLGTFSNYAVTSEWACIKIAKHIPLKAAALLGCSVPTGWGSAVNAAETQPGDTIIVMGVGGIGINAVQGARHAGAERIIAVDPVKFKRDKALELGATDAVEGIAEAGDLARSSTYGQGAKATIVTVGVVKSEMLGAACATVSKSGTLVITGLGTASETGIPVNINEFAMYQKRIQGVLYGMMSPSADVPRLLSLYERGILKLDELATRSYTIDEINQGYADMHRGVNLRGVVEYQ
jgi:S-(hydroxymethyl)glutathione dehydrogenase/alcohol dehydrogenase